MEQETRKFAIQQAIILVCASGVAQKEKAVFELADKILDYINWGRPSAPQTK